MAWKKSRHESQNLLVIFGKLFPSLVFVIFKFFAAPWWRKHSYWSIKLINWVVVANEDKVRISAFALSHVRDSCDAWLMPSVSQQCFQLFLDLSLQRSLSLFTWCAVIKGGVIARRCRMWVFINWLRQKLLNLPQRHLEWSWCTRVLKPLLRSADNCSWHEWDLNWGNLGNSLSRFESASVLWHFAEVLTVHRLEMSPTIILDSNFLSAIRNSAKNVQEHKKSLEFRIVSKLIMWDLQSYLRSFFFPFANCKPFSPLLRRGNDSAHTLNFQLKVFFWLSEGRVFSKYKWVLVCCLNVSGCLVNGGSRIIANKS